jgi:hypothetical protein
VIFKPNVWIGVAACLALAAQDASRPAPAGPKTGDAKSWDKTAWEKVASRPVARVGTREITVGEMVRDAVPFFPNAVDEWGSDYGAAMLESPVLDDWVDAYVDLCVLRRDARVESLLPPARLLDPALRERAQELTPGRPQSTTAATRPATGEPTKASLEWVRRNLGFEVARNVQLDTLVPLITDEQTLRRRSQLYKGTLNARLRVRNLLLPIRDETTQKRFARARRENARLDGERLASRIRAGESFASVSQTVLGKSDSRPKDTLPWLSYDAPLPVPVLRALFAAEAGSVVGPIETRDGFYLGFVEDRQAAPPRDAASFLGQAAQILRRDDQYDLLLKLRSEVAIVIY